MTDDNVIDLQAFRAARDKKRERVTLKSKLRINEELRVEYDHPDLDFVLTWDAEKALDFGRAMMQLGGWLKGHLHAIDPETIKRRAEEKARKEARQKVALVGKNGKKLPPLKVHAWVLQTLGGHTGPNAPQVWVGMGRRKNELDARRLIDQYVEYGYRRECVRVMPVDARGRIIPPERMPRTP